MKRFLRLTKEQAFGVFDTTSPVQTHIRLDTADSFKVMTTPEFWTIMSGSGFAVPALAGTETTGLAATLQCPLCYSQALFLLDWAMTRINAGQTLPYVTTEIAGDLASTTCDFAWSNVDGTIRRKRFLGCKVATMSLTGSRDAQVMRLSLGILGSTPQGNTFDSSTDPSAIEFPEPLDSVFAVDPVLFEHARGGLTLGNGARSNFQSLTLSIQNRIKAYFDEFRFASLIRMNGRTTTLSGNSRLKATPDERATYEAGTNLPTLTTLIFSNGVNTITFSLHAKNYYTTIDESLPLDEEIYFGWSVQNMLDTSVATINPDVSVVVA